MDERLTRLTLIQKLQEDCNENSWEEFIQLYKGYVFVIIKSMSFSDEDCHDIMQKTFLKVWKNVQSFEHGGRNGQFRKWLSRISRNTALNHIKKQKREAQKTAIVQLEQKESHLSSFSEPEVEAMAEKEWGVYLANVAWNNVKDSVNDTQKAVLEMSMDGKSREEISRALSIPLNTVSVYKRRVTSILQKEIKRLENEFG